MSIQSAHNLRPTQAKSASALPYGVRVSLNANDPFRKILGPDWQRVHWYATSESRDAALAEMSRKHDYSRPMDAPALVFSKIEQRG
jgi:hypothetical protein